MAIQALRLPNGESIVYDEWSHWPRYSTVDVAAANAGNFQLDAFSYVVGGRVPSAGVAARTATPTDTNAVSKKRMNQDEASLVYAWTYEVFATSDYVNTLTDPDTTMASAPVFEAANLRRLQRDVVLQLMVGAQIRKPVARSPLSWVGQGPGSPAFASGSAIAAATSFNHGSGGPVTPNNQRVFDMPIHIESDRVSFVRVQGFRSPGVGATPALDAVTQSFRMRIYLDGLHRRPIA